MSVRRSLHTPDVASQAVRMRESWNYLDTVDRAMASWPVQLTCCRMCPSNSACMQPQTSGTLGAEVLGALLGVFVAALALALTA